MSHELGHAGPEAIEDILFPGAWQRSKDGGVQWIADVDEPAPRHRTGYKRKVTLKCDLLRSGFQRDGGNEERLLCIDAPNAEVVSRSFHSIVLFIIHSGIDVGSEGEGPKTSGGSNWLKADEDVFSAAFDAVAGGNLACLGHNRRRQR